MSQQELFQQAKAQGQEHIFESWNFLSEQQQQELLQQVTSLDFELLSKLHTTLILNKKETSLTDNLEPVEPVTLEHQRNNPEEYQKMIVLGEKALRNGQVGAMLVAGGQGSRLGFDGPKGAFPIGSLSGKSLFQLHAEKLLAISRRYNTTVPWYIMTSRDNHKTTCDFFEQYDYFGLNKDDVFFFIQGMMPAINADGKVILDRSDHIFVSPDGHGGTLTALSKSGALTDMRQRNIEYVFYFQVDNPLVKICDPLFVGYHIGTNAEMGSKVCSKRDPMEKVGIIGKRDGELAVIEYSDMSDDDMHALNSNGKLKYNNSNLAIHTFSRSFLEAEAQGETRLPWHVAYKKIPYLNNDSVTVTPEKPNGYKFETFIFDAMSDARETVLLEINRQEEFSPVKNASGEDSPKTSKRDLSNFYASWLEKCGINIERDSQGWPTAMIEIDHLYAFDANELAKKIPANIQVSDKLYLK